MSDLAKWRVHGPVKTLKSEFSTWDPDRQDWHPVKHFTVATFRPDGAISSMDTHNQDGTIAHSRWLYDDAGRVAESSSWMNDGPIHRTVHFYDETGRPIRTTHLGQDGTQSDVEVCSYDPDGGKTKVRFLFPRETGSECDAGNACGAATGYAIEGTDSAYGAPGAATMTIAYDQNARPVKVSFHDASHRPLSYVILVRDREGRLLNQEAHQGEISPFQKSLENAPPEQRERLAAMFKAAIGDAISGITYTYDAKGRRVKRENRMGNLGGDTTTYLYNDHDDPVEETTGHRTRKATMDETGNIQYSADQVHAQQNRLEYLYDANGNWTERIVSSRPESEPSFQRSNVERRTITYYSL